jgi:hypothetical protein
VTDDERAAQRAYQAKYERSAKGKATQARYNQKAWRRARLGRQKWAQCHGLSDRLAEHRTIIRQHSVRLQHRYDLSGNRIVSGSPAGEHPYDLFGNRAKNHARDDDFIVD